MCGVLRRGLGNNSRVGRLGGLASRVNGLLAGLECRPPVLQEQIAAARSAGLPPAFTPGDNLEFDRVCVYRPDGTLLIKVSPPLLPARQPFPLPCLPCMLQSPSLSGEAMGAAGLRAEGQAAGKRGGEEARRREGEEARKRGSEEARLTKRAAAGVSRT